MKMFTKMYPTLTKRKILGLFVILALLLSIFATIILVRQRQDIRQRAAEETAPKDIAVQVDNELVSKMELTNSQGLFSYLLNKDKNDPTIIQTALDFIINRRLLTKEATKRNLLARAGQIANQRFSEKTAATLPVDLTIYKNYLLDQAIREVLIKETAQWRTVDYLSIRYLWHQNPGQEEIALKKTAGSKIQDYYTKIKNGLDIRAAIKERCQDSSINYLPFDQHLRVYTDTFNGNTCREQRINSKVGKDFNPEWGDQWLTQVFKLHKGETSNILTLEEPAVGVYFVVKVLDEGGQDVPSIDSLLKNLRSVSKITIYPND